MCVTSSRAFSLLDPYFWLHALLWLFGMCYFATACFQCDIFLFSHLHTSRGVCNLLACFPAISAADLLAICLLAFFLSYSQAFLHAASLLLLFLSFLMSCNMLPSLLCWMQAFLLDAFLPDYFPTPCFLLSRLFAFFRFDWLFSCFPMYIIITVCFLDFLLVHFLAFCLLALMLP